MIQLAVMPYYRGLGLAARLLQTLADRAEEHGVATLRAQLGEAVFGVRGLLEKVGFTVDSLQLKLPLTVGAPETPLARKPAAG